jgi:hypothetical protein
MILKTSFLNWCLVLASLATASAFHVATPRSKFPVTSSFLKAVPTLEEWKVLEDGRLEGTVKDHPDYEDGSVISISPPTNQAVENAVIETTTGNKYLLQKQQQQGTTNNTSFFPTPSSNMKVDGDLHTQQQQQEETSETKQLMQKVKDAGIAGVISYALWEFGFWTISVPVCIAAYRQVTGHWPDFTNAEDLQKLGAEAFAFVNVARFAVPLRIGLALGTTPWIQKNVVDRFSKSKKDDDSKVAQEER